MRTLVATDPGTPGKANEDAAAVVGSFVVVADGATARTETGCVHGVAWFARHLVDATALHYRELPEKALAFGIQATADAHRAVCDLDDVATPGAAVAIVRADDVEVRFLVLGDVTIVVDQPAGVSVVTDNRVDRTALAERAAADTLTSGSPEKAKALIAMKHAELAARNVEGGFWVAAADPAAVAHAITWTLPRQEVQQCLIATDGAARAVSPFGLLDWRGLLNAVTTDGVEAVIQKVRDAERADGLGQRWPRNKISDDATIAYIDLRCPLANQ